MIRLAQSLSALRGALATLRAAVAMTRLSPEQRERLDARARSLVRQVDEFDALVRELGGTGNAIGW